MSWWPESMTDYQWPRGLLTKRHALKRWVNSVLFHVSYGTGRCVSALRRQEPAVLIVRTDGMGSAVLAEPLMQSIARRFAGHRVHLWAPEATCEIYRAAAFIHRRLVVSRGNREGNLELFHSSKLRAKMGYRLGRWKFGVVVYAAHSPEPLGNWLLTSVRAKQRWYNAGNTENQFATQRSETCESATTVFGGSIAQSASDHELIRNARLASAWQDNIEGQAPNIHLDQAALTAAQEQNWVWRHRANWLEANAIVGVAPVSSKAVNQYKMGSWVKVVADLWEQHRIVSALVGGPDDVGAIQRLSIRLGQIPHLMMDKKMDLLSVAGLIGSLDGLVSVDTGLAHVALAQELPTVTLVGGGHPGRYFPWPMERQAAIANHQMACEGCLGQCHLPESQCVTEIEPEQIVAAMTDLLKRKTGRPLRAVA